MSWKPQPWAQQRQKVGQCICDDCNRRRGKVDKKAVINYIEQNCGEVKMPYVKFCSTGKRKRRHSILRKFSGLERFGKALKNKKDKDDKKKKKKKKNGKPAFLLKKLNKKD